MVDNKPFSSKILLFGEYSIIRDSMALTIPYELFEGVLKFRKGENIVDRELKHFSQHLKNLSEKDELIFNFDTASFEFDVSQGLFFDSTIPQGFGVGSSGALCAALLHRYSDITAEHQDISYLKKIFSQMESHFHGSSSGIDPLISFLNTPLLISNGPDIKTVEIPEFLEGEGGIFLLNTGRARRTEPLVNLFLEKCSQPSFSQLCDNVLSPITDNCISAFLDGDVDSLYEFFRELSDFQYRHFSPMIPKLFKDAWRDGLKYEDYYLKLCGAGGGGFILGMTKNFKEAVKSLNQYEIRPLYKF